MAAHAIERLGYGCRAAIGKPGDNAAPGENLRIACQHCRGHRATGREAGYEDTLSIEAVHDHHCFDHLSDRKRLSTITRSIRREKPVETKVGIVRSLLLWVEQREPSLVRKS